MFAEDRITDSEIFGGFSSWMGHELKNSHVMWTERPITI
jgi:hypothetical protein